MPHSLAFLSQATAGILTMASLHSAHCPGCLARSHPLETSCLFPSHALCSLKILCSTLLTTTCLQMYQQLRPLKNGLGSLVGLRNPGTASSPVSQVLKQFSAHLLAWTLLTSPLKSSLKKKKYPFPQHLPVILNFTLNLPIMCLPLRMERQSMLSQSCWLGLARAGYHQRSYRSR